ncbi:hypothetical protein [Azospirillum sp. SYSU D00513]|uniref:hypothetical protein n=1 Tax=Azospirillum sp. SYSU D00513 TaxID=2812561 RepID=UPI001A970E37|nr:hypothetical protein [Azospirillum sp. SYSU D00513]
MNKTRRAFLAQAATPPVAATAASVPLALPAAGAEPAFAEHLQRLCAVADSNQPDAALLLLGEKYREIQAERRIMWEAKRYNEPRYDDLTARLEKVEEAIEEADPQTSGGIAVKLRVLYDQMITRPEEEGGPVQGTDWRARHVWQVMLAAQSMGVA